MDAEAQVSGYNIPVDFTSFDMLWFDIESKVREMLAELNQPLLDKIFQQKEVIG